MCIRRASSTFFIVSVEILPTSFNSLDLSTVLIWLHFILESNGNPVSLSEIKTSNGYIFSIEAVIGISVTVEEYLLFLSQTRLNLYFTSPKSQLKNKKSSVERRKLIGEPLPSAEI